MLADNEFFIKIIVIKVPNVFKGFFYHNKDSETLKTKKMAMRFSNYWVESKSKKLENLVSNLINDCYLRQSTVIESIREFSEKNPKISGTVMLKGDGVKIKLVLPLKD